MLHKIEIFDTTLRDGEQSPGCSMTHEEKVKMAIQLERLNVDVIEAGFPVASKGEFDAVRAVSDVLEKTCVAALCRTRILDIDHAWSAIKHAAKPRIHTFIATSEIHMKHKLKMSPTEVTKTVREMVNYAASKCDNIEFSAEDASRSTISFLVEVVGIAIENGATVINLPDTVGYALPDEYGFMFSEIRRQLPQTEQITLSAHCHNDLGLAVANSLVAIQNGCGQVECTINGIGERAGNAALEEIVMALEVKKQHLKTDTNVNTKMLYPTSRLLTNLIDVPVQPHKAIVGKNAFSHESGIHQDGVLKNALTYEIMTPESVGLASNAIVLGKHSGRHALQKSCAKLGIELEGEKLQHIYKAFLQVADQKKQVDAHDLKVILVKNGWIINNKVKETELSNFL